VARSDRDVRSTLESRHWLGETLLSPAV